MQVFIVCIVMVCFVKDMKVVVLLGGEFYTSIGQWFVTQLEPNDILKQKLLRKNINFISWENKSALYWVNMDENTPCNYKKQLIKLSYSWQLQIVWYGNFAMNTEINGTGNSNVGIW